MFIKENDHSVDNIQAHLCKKDDFITLTLFGIVLFCDMHKLFLNIGWEDRL